MEQNISINKHIAKFGAAYFIGISAMSIIFHILEIDQSSGASIAILVGAAMYTVGKFIEENRRVPNKSEKSKLVWLSLLLSIFSSILILLLFIFALDGIQGLRELFGFIEEIDTTTLLIASLVAALIHFGALTFSYGYLARKQYEGLLKKGKF